MSKYGWERGEIKLPSAEAVAFRHGMVNFYNELQTRLYDRAQSIYTQLKAAGKGKRNYDFSSAFDLLMLGITDSYTLANPTANYNTACVRNGEPYEKIGYAEIKDALFPYDSKIGRDSRKPKAPKKSQFKSAKLSAKGLAIGHEAGIEFQGSTVVWSVAENNHSVDNAHDHPVGKEFFRRLSQVEWTNRSGGEIVGNDEYNEEGHGAGQRANYVTQRFGAAQTQFKKSIAVGRF